MKKEAEEPAMTLHNIFLLGAVASMGVIIQIIRFANKTVKIRKIWDSVLETNRTFPNR